MLPPEAIKEFKDIYQQEYKKEISDKEALGLASELINLFKVINRPIERNEYEPQKSQKGRVNKKH